MGVRHKNHLKNHDTPNVIKSDQLQLSFQHSLQVMIVQSFGSLPGYIQLASRQVAVPSRVAKSTVRTELKAATKLQAST